MSKARKAVVPERRCRECGQGTIRLQARGGRFARYKTMQNLEIPEDLALPTCDRCGAEWLSKADAERLTKALEEVYCLKLRQRVVALLKKLSSAIQKKELERLLGLSQGYLSHLASGERDPSPTLVGQLAILALDPEARVEELRTFWASKDLVRPNRTSTRKKSAPTRKSSRRNTPRSA